MLIKNFSYSIFYKIIGLLVSLSLVPLLINILGVENYGLWVTLTSLLVWISLFDFGLGYALKNTVSKSIAKNSYTEAQEELRQILKITIFISFFLLILFILFLLNNKILLDHTYLVSILFLPYILSFPIKTGSQVLQGSRKIALDAGLTFLNPLLFFTSVSLISIYEEKVEPLHLSILFVSSYLLSITLIWINAKKTIEFNNISLSNILQQTINFSRIHIGLKFFGLQLSSLVLYSIGTVISFNYLGAVDAARFDVLNKVFIFGLSIFNIGIAVFWPEIAHNLQNNKFRKINKLYLTMLVLAVIFSLLSFVTAYISPYIVNIWTGGRIQVNHVEAVYFAFLVSTQAISYSGAVVLNAFEKINYQLLLSIVSTIVMLPLAIYFINHGWGIASIALAAGLLTLTPAFYCNIHALILIRNGFKNDTKNIA
jgi:O-antigen/teichoic acid export membrane protein